MKKLLLCIASVGLFAFLTSPAIPQEKPKNGVFIHISHGTDDPHRLLMALHMAVMMAEEHDVLVYFDIKAIDAVLKDSPDISYAHFASSKAQIRTLLDKNVTLMACPGCLKAANKTKGDLADGIQIADGTKFFSFTQGRILTLDY